MGEYAELQIDFDQIDLGPDRLESYVVHAREENGSLVDCETGKAVSKRTVKRADMVLIYALRSSESDPPSRNQPSP